MDKSEHIPSELWKEIQYFPDVYYMQGNAIKSKDLKKAGIPKAEAVIILSSNIIENDKTLDIILQFENSFKKSNISEQGFLSFCNNNYFFNGLIGTINKYIQSEENISEYEGHIMALTNLLFMIFTSLDNNSDFSFFYMIKNF